MAKAFVKRTIIFTADLKTSMGTDRRRPKSIQNSANKVVSYWDEGLSPLYELSLKVK